MNKGREKNFWQNFNKPICGLAPMAGVTDEPMRKVYSQTAKPDVMYTEFISAEGYFRNRNFFRKQLEFTDSERPVIAQVFGSDAEAVSASISEIAEMGFDGIDINMGCPARSVVEKGGGGALIGNEKLAGEIITKAYDSIKKSGRNIPLSVKTRIGNNEDVTERWAEFLSQYPLSAVCFHGRLLRSANSGPVNYYKIALAAKIIKAQGKIFLGNGGVNSRTEGNELSKKFGFDGVLIAKAALGNPHVFSGHVLTRNEILDLITVHARYGWDFYGEKDFIKLRKHFGWYPKGFRWAKELRIELLKTVNLTGVIEIVNKFRSNKI